MSLIHNMSQPPRTAVVIAPHRAGPRTELVLSLGAQDWNAAFARLTEQAQEEGATGDLAQWSAERLQGLGCPEVGLVRDEGRPVHEAVDPVLALAVLARCTGSLFLLRRQPRWDPPSIGQKRGLTVLDPALVQVLRGRR